MNKVHRSSDFEWSILAILLNIFNDADCNSYYVSLHSWVMVGKELEMM
jgi:hypothetical protein